MTWIHWKWIMKAALFISLWAMFFFAWRWARHLGRESKREQIKTKITQPYFRRLRKEEEQWTLFGEEEKHSLFYRLDRLVDYSDVQSLIPFACAEAVLGLMSVLALGGLCAGIALGIGWHIGLFIGVVCALLCILTLCIMADVRYDRIEDGLFAFVNVVSTESKSSDDLVTILGESVKLLCKPLQKVVENFCTEARATGRIAQSLHHMVLSVENEEFCKIVRNLAMCYRTDADYAKVIRECRIGLKEHINAREEQKVLLGNSGLELLELVGLGTLTLVLIGNIIGESNVVLYLNQTIPGRIVLIYILGVMTWCIADAILTRRPK